MIRNLLLVAFVCVSVAQVHGGELEDTINSGLLQVRGLYENAVKSLEGAQKDVAQKKEHISYQTYEFIQNALKIQENTTEALRVVANATKEEAKKNGSPESVFECIKKEEQRAKGDIASQVSNFITGMEKLKVVKQQNVDNATESYKVLRHDLEETFISTCKEMTSCQNVDCVHKVFANYSVHMKSFHMVVKRVEEQIGAAVAAFHSEANDSFRNFERQTSNIKSAGIENIRKCCKKGGKTC